MALRNRGKYDGRVTKLRGVGVLPPQVPEMESHRFHQQGWPISGDLFRKQKSYFSQKLVINWFGSSPQVGGRRAFPVKASDRGCSEEMASQELYRLGGPAGCRAMIWRGSSGRGIP